MICENYVSEVVPYRLTADMGDDGYHLEIPAPWWEALYSSIGLVGAWVDGDTVNFAGWLAVRSWPGWSVGSWAFNAVTGEFVGRFAYPASGWSLAQEIYEGVNSAVSYMGVISGAVFPYDKITGVVDTVNVILPSTYGRIVFDSLMIDVGRNRLVTGGQSGARQIEVYDFLSGALLKTIATPYSVKEVVYAGDTRVYALLTDGALLGLDYLSGDTFQHTMTPIITSAPGLIVRMAWSRKYRRLFVCTLLDDNPDGTANTRFRGYRNLPIATHLCKPIPLKRLRTGVKCPVLVKQIGDLGEGLPGGVTVEGDAIAVITRNVIALDGDGEGTTEVIGSAEGAGIVSVTAEVACQP